MMRMVRGLRRAMLGGVGLFVAVTPVAAQRRLVAREDLRISSETHGLSAFKYLAVSSRGVIAVGQNQDKVVRFFDAEGRPAGKFGFQGEGPGGIMVIGGLGWFGDTTWVLDPRNRRVTYVDPQRRMLRTLTAPMTVRPANGSAAEELSPGFPLEYKAVYGDGTLLVRMQGASEQKSPAWLRLDSLRGWPLLRLASNGSLQKIALKLSAEPYDCDVRVPVPSLGGVEAGTAIPFCAYPVQQLAGDGSRLVRVSPRAVRNGIWTYEVMVVDLVRGDTVVRQAVQTTARPVSIPSRDSARAVIQNHKNLAPEVKKAVLARTWPVAYPPCEEVVAGTDGTIWVRENVRTETTVQWRVLDGKGMTIGVVDLPASLTLRVVSRTTIHGILTTEDGDQHIVRLAVG